MMPHTPTKQSPKVQRWSQRQWLTLGLVLVGSAAVLNTAILSAQAEELAHVRRLLFTRFCSKCNLKNANLSGKDLQGVRITDTKLKRANLRGANLRFATLRNVNLKYADLTDADLTGATLKNVKLKGAILDGAKLPLSQETVLPNNGRPTLPNIQPKIQIKPQS